MLNDLSTSNLSDDLHNIVLIQQIRILKLTDLIYTVRRKLPLSSEELYRSSRSRQKRGLFDFVGVASNYLFGTAQASDVEKLGKQMNELALAAKENNRMIIQSYKAIQLLGSSMKDVIDTTNDISRVVNGLMQTIL